MKVTDEILIDTLLTNSEVIYRKTHAKSYAQELKDYAKDCEEHYGLGVPKEIIIEKYADYQKQFFRLITMKISEDTKIPLLKTVMYFHFNLLYPFSPQKAEEFVKVTNLFNNEAQYEKYKKAIDKILPPN